MSSSRQYHEWNMWLNDLPRKLSNHMAEKRAMEQEVREQAICINVTRMVCEFIARRENLRTIFFGKMDNGDESTAHNGQYWLDRFIIEECGSTATFSDPNLLVTGGAYPELEAGMMVNLPIAAWPNVTESTSTYHYVSTKVDEWLTENLRKLKHQLVEHGDSQLILPL